MPYPNEHAARLKDPGAFIPASFRRKNIAPGIDLIMGKLKADGPEGPMTTQAYRFDRERFTAAEARAWLKEHDVEVVDFEEAEGEEKAVAVHDIPGASYAVKALREENGGIVVGGYLCLWGSPTKKDLQGDYFTPTTETWYDRYPTVPALFHHGLDDSVGLATIGRRVKAAPDATGLWVEDWLDVSNQYWKMVKPLLDAEALFYSPGSAPHLIKRAADGKLLSFPVVEDTLTPVPAQPRLRPIAQVTAAYKAAGLEIPADLTTGDADTGDAGASRPADPERERVRARIAIAISEIDMEV